jgi:hypothetical protein
VVSDAAVIRQAFRFALDPSVEQERFLAACAGASPDRTRASCVPRSNA